MLILTRADERRMLFCEQSFGTFFFIWGFVLIADDFYKISSVGLFYGHLQQYMPGWAWGCALVAIAIGRFTAYRYKSDRFRIVFSVMTCMLLVSIGAVAAWAELWSGAVPLISFIAYTAFRCHSAMLRDMHLGL